MRRPGGKQAFYVLLMAGALFFGARLACTHFRNASWPIRNAPPSRRRIICFGDSLVAGVGAGGFSGSYPAALQRITGWRVRAFGYPGATAEQGAKHLPELPDVSGGIVIVTLGGNDILRRVPLEDTCRWLQWIFTALQKRGAVVVYTGVSGLFSGERTDRCRRLCRRNGVLFIPDILGGILTRNDLKSDTVHPNAEGYRRIAERIAAILTKAGWTDASS